MVDRARHCRWWRERNGGNQNSHGCLLSSTSRHAIRDKRPAYSSFSLDFGLCRRTNSTTLYCPLTVGCIHYPHFVGQTPALDCDPAPRLAIPSRRQHHKTLQGATTMPPSKPIFSTPLTKLFGINHPVMLAGMNVRQERG